MRNITQSYVSQFSIEDMRRFALEAWGELGANVVERWCEFNATYFGGALKPVPLVITHTQPFGKRIGPRRCARINGRPRSGGGVGAGDSRRVWGTYAFFGHA